MTEILRRRILPGILFLAALPAAAHHFFNSEYDTNRPVRILCVVTKLEWFNPHIWIYADEKRADGTAAKWAFTAGSPNQLMRRGVLKDDVKPGTAIVVEGFRSKDGSNSAFARTVTFADGRTLHVSGLDDVDH